MAFINKLHFYNRLNFGFFFVLNLSRLVQPICLGGLVGYFAQTEDVVITQKAAYWYATGIVLSTAFMIITFHPFILFIFKTACKVRVGKQNVK